jgi:hypothetical protein
MASVLPAAVADGPQTFWNQVPLTRAVEADHFHIATYLTEHGSDLEAEAYVRAAFHHACLGGGRGRGGGMRKMAPSMRLCVSALAIAM